jgi:hypothetical protein
VVRIKHVLLLMLPLLVAFTCHKEAAQDKRTYSKIRFDAPHTDFPAPIELKKEIDKIFYDHVIMPADADATDNKVSLQVPKRFFSYKLRISEDTPGVLGGENFEIQFPKGGGVLDFGDLPIEKSGSMTFNWEFPDGVEGEKNMHVFYLSNAKTRKVDGQSVGSGCNTFYEITSFFFGQRALGGLRVNTAKNRHISFLAGTYIFVKPEFDALLVAQLIVQDNNHRDLLCRF